MRAEFTPDNHYAGLLAQAKALFRITQSQESIISTLRSKLTELESQLAMAGTAEIEAQRAANEQLTNEIELIAAKCDRLTESFATLMEHSTGVAGLHLNGDVAPWSELTEGGRFEEWLLPLSEPRDQSIDALKAQWQAEAIPDFIRDMGERLRTQDNRITADPLFCVFQKRTIVVPDEYDHECIEWFSGDDQCTADEEEAERLEELRSDMESDYWHEDTIPLDGKEFRRIAVAEYDEFVTASFTEDDANDHIRMNGHNLRKPFVFVTSLYRTPEMIELREWLKAQGIQEVTDAD